MLVLGIETSCDETAASVVRDGRDVLSHVVLSQIAAHRPYNGVVPEIASRAHVEALPPLLDVALQEAAAAWDDIDLLAVTHGPGLASSLLIGVTAARALALRLGKPVTGVNHLAGHLYSVLLDPAVTNTEALFPMIVLLVTGGHTLLVRMDSVAEYRLLGQTLDDAVGEALDKGATLMDLGYPGGPEIEKASQDGDARRHPFPRGLQSGKGEVSGGLPRDRCFSFSGLKTALLYLLRDHPDYLANGARAHVAASYQEAAFDALLDRLERVVREEGVRHFACVGGVAKNMRLRAKLEALAGRFDAELHVAPMTYCTDNAAMIAGLAGALALRGAPLTPLDDVYPNLPIGPHPRIHSPARGG